MTDSLFRACLRADLPEEVVALIVHQDKRRKILNLNLPDRFHPQFRILVQFDLLDMILRQYRRRAADGAQIKAAVFLTCLGHLRTPIALCQRDHGGAVRLKQTDI